MNFDAKIAHLKGPDYFKRFNVTEDGMLLQNTNIEKDAQLLTFKCNGLRLAVLVKQMVYHHVAQGVVKGEPYLVTF